MTLPHPHLRLHPCAAEVEADTALRHGGPEHQRCCLIIDRLRTDLGKSIRAEQAAVRHAQQLEEEIARLRAGIGDLRGPRRAA